MDGNYEIHVNPGYGKRRFSRRELTDIGISMVVLAVAFMILYRNNTISWYLGYYLGDAGKWAALLAVCLVIVVFSFLLHEFGHKFVAQRFGLWSEFRMYPMGLLLTLVTSLLGFLFAAPGAVYIDGPMDRTRNGKISIAGPAINIVIAGVCTVIIAVLGSGMGSMVMVDDARLPVYLVCSMLGSLNAFLAVFNLLPVPPLDGSKIFAWNKALWIVAFVIAVAELAFIYLGAPGPSTIGYYA